MLSANMLRQLFAFNLTYDDQCLKYVAIPLSDAVTLPMREGSGGYNSGSYVRGMAEALSPRVSVIWDDVSLTWDDFEGSLKPVPERYFRNPNLNKDQNCFNQP